MPSSRRRASAIDAETAAETPKKPEDTQDAATALALAEEAEAEAAAAEAKADAARARARAIRLRQEGEGAESKATNGVTPETTYADTDSAAEPLAETEDESTDESKPAPAVEDATAVDEVDEAEEKPARKRRLPRLRWKAVAAGLAILCIGALLTASGYVVWQHRLAQHERQQTAEYSAAARQGVVTLMSLDFNKAKEDVQSIIDNTTGTFKEDFVAQAEDFAKVAQDSKVVTHVTVNAAAVKSMTDDTAQVIVAATSRVSNAQGANQEPRPWRMLVELTREGDQIKMSKVEFVP